MKQRCYNKGYSPDNCRWANRSEQRQNQRDSYKLDYHGKLKTTKEIAKIENVPWQTAYNWYVRGDKVKLPIKYLYKRVV